MFDYRPGKLSLIFILILTAFNTCYAEKAKMEKSSPIAVVYSAERKGSFLSEPGNVPFEFLRRIGRGLNKVWPLDKKIISAASIFALEKIGTKDFLKPQLFVNLTAEQKKAAQSILDRFSSDADKLLGEIEPEEKCIFLRAAAETAPLKEIFKNFSENSNLTAKLREDQILKIKNQILPMLEASDYIIAAAVLSKNGFKAKVRIKSLDSKLSNPKINHTLSISKYINPDSLMVFAQTHPIEDPAEVMKGLNTIPQTATVLSAIASAGLDMEKDLIANSARESILYLNFDPTGDGGIPDIRFVAPVPDIEKLESILDKLKNLCVKTGIFVNTIEESFKIVRLSFFMFPQYGIYAGLADEFLTLGTSKENLQKEMNFIKQVKAGKMKGEEIIPDLQRYWRISFEEFNFQLQKFLQSPLMLERGIPPISNLTLLDDLAALTILTKLQPDQIDFSVFLPVKETLRK